MHQCPANYRQRASETRVRYLYPYRFTQNLITTPFRRWPRELVPTVYPEWNLTPLPEHRHVDPQIGAPDLRARPIGGKGRQEIRGTSPLLCRASHPTSVRANTRTRAQKNTPGGSPGVLVRGLWSAGQRTTNSACSAPAALRLFRMSIMSRGDTPSAFRPATTSDNEVVSGTSAS